MSGHTGPGGNPVLEQQRVLSVAGLMQERDDDAEQRQRLCVCGVHDFDRCIAQARHRSLRVDLSMNDRFFDLSKGEAEVAVRAHSPGDDTSIARKIADAPWAVYATRSYIERHGRAEGLAQLGAHAVIEFSGEMAGNHAGQWLRTAAPGAAVAARANTMLGRNTNPRPPTCRDIASASSRIDVGSSG
jgi:hypothetical protein